MGSARRLCVFFMSTTMYCGSPGFLDLSRQVGSGLIGTRMSKSIWGPSKNS